MIYLHRLEKYQLAEFVDLKDFDEKMREYFQNQDQEINYSSFQVGALVPVAIKEIRTAFGKCFFLHSKQNATLEQKIQGWKIYLHSNRSDKDIVWQVYLGYHGLEYPTFSDLGTHERFLLRPRTETFVSFSLNTEKTLPYRGYFQPKKFCSEGDMFETIACTKKCFLDQNKVFIYYFLSFLSICLFQLNCTPSGLNTFDQLNVSHCSSPFVGNLNMKTIFSNSMNINTFCPHCLPPCSKHSYSFHVRYEYIFFIHIPFFIFSVLGSKYRANNSRR